MGNEYIITFLIFFNLSTQLYVQSQFWLKKMFKYY